MSKKDNIFLIGFMGAGKSTIARALHRALGIPLVEMDERIVDEQGMSINEIFSRFGEERFREMESSLIAELADNAPNVVSCGGGVVLRPENTARMKKSGRIVYLSATPETVYERVKNSTERPVLNGHMNVEYIGELMEKRRALYEAAADLVVATDAKSREELCNEIISRLEEL
ncbi:MAG: shikimate kinase [Muribaculaceae bacterium]|nr:shikimate kinase [Roseburia sp.]MCM1430064.1 shikimate kinase [Muribaculaceae bacterium]MCM1493863.1 shikimate kinase [Muribaculaceae bacterium]